LNEIFALKTSRLASTDQMALIGTIFIPIFAVLGVRQFLERFQQKFDIVTSGSDPHGTRIADKGGGLKTESSTADKGRVQKQSQTSADTHEE
jgi:hypothetical protein